MKTVNFQDADFCTLVHEAAAGEEIIIAKSGKPLARLLPLEEPEIRRGFGMLKGKVWIDEDRFDDPLPEDFLKPFGIEE